jgi:hypothetical protein
VRIVKNWGQGCYIASDMVNGQLVTKLYYGYTKDEVISEFTDYIRYLYDSNYEPSELVDETFAR